MSVELLQARIAKISADINLQKEVLKQLEQSKSAAQRQLNAIRDPVAQLPPEISSEIFLRCRLPSWRSSNVRQAPMLLLKVCKAWRGIVLSTPALWADISLDSPRVEILEVWARRARNYPLSVTLYRGLGYHVTTSLAKFAQQLKHLTIYEERLTSRSFQGLVPFPYLETLEVGANMNDDQEYNAFSLRAMINLLRLTPNLLECTFHFLTTFLDHDTTDRLVISTLRSLKFSWSTWGFNEDTEDRILKYLSLPALETLALPFSSLTTADFASFLAYSSPPLRQLVLGDIAHVGFFGLEECLRLVPSVTYFELYAKRNEQHMKDLFTSLADSPSTLLPNLHTLKIKHDCSSVSESVYDAYLHALSVRRAQIVCAHVIKRDDYDDQEKPSLEVCAGLRQLAAGGMDIHIGTLKKNFIEI
ncbi:F-box domain-containing protein [Mycena venus]|uniref:F-box domain-containing protein n=1 Tax=Mycena venus TaxID=2733690 RepID=A0A8H6X3T0_9AGAR|nr:F-box domain-containing protein [Mycena venus]